MDIYIGQDINLFFYWDISNFMAYQRRDRSSISEPNVVHATPNFQVLGVFYNEVPASFKMISILLYFTYKRVAHDSKSWMRSLCIFLQFLLFKEQAQIELKILFRKRLKWLLFVVIIHINFIFRLKLLVFLRRNKPKINRKMRSERFDYCKHNAW